MTARRKRLVLVACILGTTVVSVDSTVVNVALPAIRADLGGGFAGQQWVVNAYLIALASLILVGGSLGDLFGERRVFTIGMAAFGVTSLLCALAPTIELLVVARGLQGVAGAALTPAALAVIVAVFDQGERGRAVGAWTAWGAVGMVLGPLVGGQLIDSFSWRWIFIANLPLVAIALVLVARVVPQARDLRRDARIDVTGALLCVAGLAALTFGLIRQPDAGWADATVLGPLAGAAVLLPAFVAWQARTAHPMLPLGLFASRNFAVGNLETLLMYAGLSLLSFFLVLFLQQGAGYDAIQAGLTTVPITAVMFALSTRFGALADRYGPRAFMGAGPLVAAAGLALLTRVPADVSYVRHLLPALLVFSVGLAATVAPLTSTVLAGADASNAGTASGVNNAIARLAGMLGVAGVGALVAGRYGAGAGADVGSFHLAMAISAGLVAAGGLLGLIGIENPRREVKASGCPGGQIAGAPAGAAEGRAAAGALQG